MYHAGKTVIYTETVLTFRDLPVDVLSQWDTTLHCNVVSHWVGAYTNEMILAPWKLILYIIGQKSLES